MTPPNVERVLASVRMWGDAGTFPKIASTLNGAIPPRTLKRWLSQLVRDGRLIRHGGSTATRYSVAAGSNGNRGGPVALVAPGLSSPRERDGKFGGAAGVRESRLGVLPERSSVSYPRSILDLYRPNETFYLAEPLRTKVALRVSRLTAVPTAGVTGPMAAEWQRFTADLVTWSRDAGVILGFTARRHRRLMKPAVVSGVVARADVPTMGGELRRIWNHRAAVAVLAEIGRGMTLTPASVAAVQAALRRSPSIATAGGGANGAPVTPPMNPVCRTEPLHLTETAYQPASDPVLIEGCLRQIVYTAGAIRDPAEASCFVLAHVLLLLPFAAENLTSAVLLANVPLLAAGLEPVSLAPVPLSDLRTAVLAWWELARPDLLATAWARGAEATRQTDPSR